MSTGRLEAVSDAVIVVLLLSAVAYFLLQTAIVSDQGPASTLRTAIGRDWKGKLSPTIYVEVALMWLVPDRRVERVLTGSPEG